MSLKEIAFSKLLEFFGSEKLALEEEKFGFGFFLTMKLFGSGKPRVSSSSSEE